MKIKYEAEDGTLFENEQECREYEYSKVMKEKVRSAVDVIKNFCINMECAGCPYYLVRCQLDGIPESWEVED